MAKYKKTEEESGEQTYIASITNLLFTVIDHQSLTQFMNDEQITFCNWYISNIIQKMPVRVGINGYEALERAGLSYFCDTTGIRPCVSSHMMVSRVRHTNGRESESSH